MVGQPGSSGEEAHSDGASDGREGDYGELKGELDDAWLEKAVAVRMKEVESLRLRFTAANCKIVP